MIVKRAKHLVETVAITLAFLQVLSGTAKAEETRVKVEILNLINAASIGEQEMEFLSNVVRSTFEELPRERFDSSSAQPIESLECTDECQLEACRLRLVDMVVLGYITVFGEGYAASLKLYNVSDSQLVASTNTSASGSLEELVDALKIVARDLRSNLEPKSAQKPPTLDTSFAPPIDNKQTLLPITTMPFGGTVGRLKVTSSPTGAMVFVHKKYSGRTPNGNSTSYSFI